MHRVRSAIPCILAASVLAGCGPGEDEARVVAHARVEAAEGASEEEGALPTPAATMPAGADGGLLVDVAGLVRRPGVYRLAAGSRVHEAIAAAGGARAGADLTALNRAAPLVDGQQVLVAPRGAGDDVPGRAAGGTEAAKVSINAADTTALDALPGIGPITAERIVAERDAGGPFTSIDDLDRVPGIGPATIESLREVATT